MQCNGIRSYILDDEFKIVVLNNRLNVVNYLEMGHFDSNKVIIRYAKSNENCSLIISGKNLVVSKLKVKEVLIEGVINNIEFRWYYY